MFEFFESIFSAIGSIFTYIGTLISSLAYVFVLVGKGLVYVTECIVLMPGFLQAFLLAFVAISVIYLIVGR